MTDFIHKYFEISPDMQIKIFTTIIIALILWSIYKILLRLFVSKLEDLKVRYQWKRLTLYILVGAGLLVLSRVWFGAFEGLATYLGLLSAGIAIALKDPIVNLSAWIFIIIRKPFKIGDRIQIGNITGDVIDIRIFQFSVMEIGNWVDADQSTGRIIHIPNGIVFTTSQANYTAGFEYIWNEIPVLLTFESNWKSAKEILSYIVSRHAVHLSEEAERQIKEAAKKFLIYYNKLTPIVYVSVKDSGVMLTMRFLCKARERRGTEDLIWKDVLDTFAKHIDIDFAYPTQRFYNNLTEGKNVPKF